MKRLRVLFIFVIGLMLLAALASTTSAAPSTYEFTVNNKTTKTLEVTLLGAQNYIISSPPTAKTKTDVKPGNYQYSFYDCGKLIIGTVNMNKDRELTITQCNASTGGTSGGGQAAELVDIVLNNKTYKTLTVALVGIQNYSFDLVPGKTFANVYKGTYQMSYYDCGQLNISTAKITKDGFQAKFFDCGKVTDAGSTGGTVAPVITTFGPDEVRLFVKNDTFSSFEMFFISDLVYTYNILPGKNKISIRPGNYQFSYYACGKLWISNIKITHKDQDIRISSCDSKSGSPNTGQNIVFKVKNLTGSKFTMYLNGPQFYILDVRGSSSTLFEVEKGYYTFQYFACGNSITGEVFLKDGVTLKTIDCPEN